MCIKTMGSDKTDRIKFGKLNPLLKVLKKKIEEQTHQLKNYIMHSLCQIFK